MEQLQDVSTCLLVPAADTCGSGSSSAGVQGHPPAEQDTEVKETVCLLRLQEEELERRWPHHTDASSSA